MPSCSKESCSSVSDSLRNLNLFWLDAGEWRQMSLPAMLVGETVGEILQASRFAREIVAAVACKTKKTTIEDPKTPVTQRRKQKPHSEDTGLKSRRKSKLNYSQLDQNPVLHVF
ncbi:MICROTUBULE-BINDING PROTEIN TANGLED-RELATED [Salix viminalis]|uniref:MICROTUBULE-BINDING PROTEIN TANGLED-RELATED n=4 Tax=Salix TaxID=40685 RepID=A0A9Q0SR02_SALPP|nr:MICROTUBULE-BINDING PROTEIN TANGLED-RELATED [Salix viminalis]KAJ6686130.1 MICROTUBULE-BINDING PROTEIN TANGLED-RELATED [Salix purpurea]